MSPAQAQTVADLFFRYCEVGNGNTMLLAPRTFDLPEGYITFTVLQAPNDRVVIYGGIAANGRVST